MLSLVSVVVSVFVMGLFVHDAYDELAKKFPKTEAVVHAKTLESMTYCEVASLSVAFSRKLRFLGAGIDEMTVCVVSGRDLNLLPLYVGVSRVPQCSLLPLPNWAEASLSGIPLEKWICSTEYAISSGGVSLVIVDEVNDSWKCDCRVLTWTEFIAIEETNLVPPNLASCTSDNSILQLLSGGSTGSPKLHAISHRMVLSELKGYPAIVPWNSCPISRRVLQQSSLAWPASAFGQVNIALAFGGTLVIAPSQSVEELAKDVENLAVTIIGGAPSQLNLLLDFSSLHIPLMFTWGEPLARSLGSRFSQRTTVLIELLVATEYWLCLYCSDLSGTMSVVPDCTVSVVDPDAHGVGQLTLSGPMVRNGGPLVTNDLVHVAKDKVDFVGRVDFLTKIAGNWFDLRDLERACLALPAVREAVAVARKGIHYLCVSVDEEEVIWELRKILKKNSPVEMTIRVLAELPKISTTGKMDRRALLWDRPEHVGLVAAKERFFVDLKSQAKWISVFALLLGPKWALAAPYMYLVTLYLPNVASGHLPRTRVRSAVAYFGYCVQSLFRELPFGRAGLIVLLACFARRSNSSKRLLQLWTVLGMWLAWRGGRLGSWWVTFWLGGGREISNESSYWLRARKWGYLWENVKFLVLSLPDATVGTTYCQNWDETKHQANYEEKEKSSEKNDEENDAKDSSKSVSEDEFVIPPNKEDDLIDSWWYNSPVQYISVPRGPAPRRPAPVLTPDPEDPSTLAGFARACLQTVSQTCSLIGLSSLQVTTLVQLLRKRVPGISARAVMAAADLPALLAAMETAVSENNTPHRHSNKVKIQFSAGQINRVCRWMLRAKTPVDRARLAAAVAALVARHPLLRGAIEEPKALHSFVHDTAVVLVNLNRLMNCHQGSLLWGAVHHVLSRCVYGAWSHVTVFPPNELPAYWVDTLTTSRVSDMDHMRRMTQTLRRDVEENWYTHQNPLNVHLFALGGVEEYILISVKHSFSDGNSAIPILDDLAMLYEQAEGSSNVVCPLETLQKRCFDGITSNLSNPDRTALRCGMYESADLAALGGGSYRHYLCLEPGAIALLRRCAATQLMLNFDSVLLGLIAISLMRADQQAEQTFTLYCPLRDGANESGYVGLLTDWRDITFAAVKGATVWDTLSVGIADRIKSRDWDPTLPPGSPEAVLLNWLAFDGTPRLNDQSWEPFHLDKMNTRWNRMMEKRDFEPYDTPSGRARTMSLEQYEVDGQWWLRFDVAARMYPAKWMMRFSEEMNRTFTDIVTKPMTTRTLD